jgi:outer membrane protein insertion porin family
LITSKSKYFILILLPAFLTGCLGTQHLKENQKRLIRQSVKAPKYIDEEELKELYAQRPNRRLLGLPIYHLVAMYYWGAGDYDKEKYVRKKAKFEQKFDRKIANTTSQRKINNLQFRKQKKIARMNSFIEDGNLRMQWGEKVAVFDTTLVEITVERFKNHLASAGYFQNEVTTKTTSIGKFTTVSYRVETSAAYIVDTIFYKIADTAVFKTIIDNQNETFLKVGDRYDGENLTKERERLDLLLKDHGFYDFSRQYIILWADTSMLGNKRVALMLEILDPAKRGYHKQFTIDSVKFITDSGVPQPGRKRTKKFYRDVQYQYFDDYYNLKILSQRLFLTPGDLYSRTKNNESQRQLANLDAFKFVNIVYDTTGGKFIANVFTNPMDRYEWSNEAGVNVTQGYPGPFYSVNFKKRNIFRGLENFELTGRIGIEGAASAAEESVYRSIEAGVNASLIFPQFIFPFREATQLRLGKYNPKTRLSIGYNYTDRPEYRRTSITLANTYTWQNQKSLLYSLAPANVSLINSVTDSSFQRTLETLELQGNYALARSFKASFVSSMIFGITWNHNYGALDKNSLFLRAQVEPGGSTINFLKEDTLGRDFIERAGLQTFRYLRFSVDFRRIRILNKWANLAYRINTGVAYAYGDSIRALPYEKFYFVGGSKSVRAWSPRRLGLGSSSPPLASDPAEDGLYNYQFEKPGEILLEASIELRTKLVGFIDGAIFLDAGNVWSFEQQAPKDPTDATGKTYIGNTQFRARSFLKELGIGTGFGLRFDFTFLILSFDVGIKVHDPARPEGDRFVLDRVRFFKPYATKTETGFINYKEPVIYNVGIGYPF